MYRGANCRVPLHSVLKCGAFSVAARPPLAEELEDLAKRVDEYLALSDKLRRNAGSVELKQERQKVRQAIVARFGSKVWALQSLNTFTSNE